MTDSRPASWLIDEQSQMLALAMDITQRLKPELDDAAQPMSDLHALANAFDIVLDRWLTLSESLGTPPKMNRCGWCVRAAGDDDAAWAAAPRYELAEQRAHTLSCPHNPLVRQLAEIRARLALTFAETWRAEMMSRGIEWGGDRIGDFSPRQYVELGWDLARGANPFADLPKETP